MKPIAIDIFAGAGGISEGLTSAGFRIPYAIESNERAAETYAYNHRYTYLDIRDAREVRSEEIFQVAGDKIGLVAGGPPCQGFSMLGGRKPDDPRNNLVWEFIKKVGELQPRFFLMENVPGILTMNGGLLAERIMEEFRAIGYHPSKRILDAAKHGVPQHRERVFFFGSKSGKRNIEKAAFREAPPISTKEAISDLDFLRNGESSRVYKLPPETPYQKKMRDNQQVLFNHDSTLHSKEVVNRFSRILPGKSMQSIPSELQIKKNIMHRLEADKPSRTITSLPDDYIHYSSHRILTVRECARLQSFRDGYVFMNNRTTGGRMRKGDCPQYTQVGNSVPPLLVDTIGKWILGDW